MKYVFFGLAAVSTAAVLFGYCLQQVPLLNALILWFACGFLASLVSLVLRPVDREDFLVLKQHPRQLTLYFAISICASLFWCAAVQTVGVGVTSFIGNMRLLVLVLVGVLAFKEQLLISDLIAAAALFIGLYLFSSGGDARNQLGILYAVLAMCCYSGQQIINKTLGRSRTVSYRLVLSMRAFFVILACTTMALVLGKELYVPTDISLLIAFPIGGSLGCFYSKYFDFKALETVSLSQFSLWSTFRPLLVFTMGVVFLHEELTANKVYAGIMFTLGFVLLLNHQRSHVRAEQV